MGEWWETDSCKKCGLKDCGMIVDGYCLICLKKIGVEWEKKYEMPGV